MRAENTPLVSVVVPIYNVQEYLRQCVDSIIGQTYNKLQIILVDDGSPDECGKIIDEYSERDPRIICIHKPNGGLSSARNAGKAAATGEYIAFIDSDDYIDSRFIEILLKDVLDNAADISMCYFDSFINEAAVVNVTTVEKPEIYSSQEAVRQMYRSDSFGWNAWNKLYRTELFRDVEYPEGVICEDKATTYKLLLEADKVTYRDLPLYHYRIRPNSISGQRSVKYYTDSMMIDDQMERDLDASGPQELADLARSYTAKSSFLIYSEVLEKKGYEQIAESARDKLSRYYKYLRYADYINGLQKAAIYIAGSSSRYGKGTALNMLSRLASRISINRASKLS